MSEEARRPRSTIKPVADGPYLVQGLNSLTNSKDEELDARPKMMLCRCGGSTNKPYCDGTHLTNGFSGAKRDDGSKDNRQDYEAGELIIHDNRGICAHVGRCTDGLPSVFKLGEEPWIDPTGAETKAIAATVRLCPSGALSHSIGSEEYRDIERPPAIVVSKDGPYFITWGVELEGEEWGEGASREHFALCRCGGSNNKPFCDGTRWKGFKDDKN